MTVQLPLALDLRHAPSLDDFVVGANGGVLEVLRGALEADGEDLVFLAGAAGSGRTHLLSAQCARGAARGLRCAYLPLAEADALSPRLLQGLESLDLVAIDDVHAIGGHADWEEALFHLFNRCRAHGTRLLFSADRGPAALPVALPDLRSRLAWGVTLVLRPLDDDARLQLLKALAGRRALELPDEVARYLLERTARHPKALAAMVERLDQASLVEKRRLTIPFVRRHLGLGDG